MTTTKTDHLPLTNKQVEDFLKDGVLVVDNVLSATELDAAWEGLRHTLQKHGVDTSNLEQTGHNLQALSSTNGSGGVLDIFYDQWKIKVASHIKLFAMTRQLWQAAYCHCGEEWDSLSKEDQFHWQPHGSFDVNKGYMYIDRIGYRLPTLLAEKIGAAVAAKDGGYAKRKNKQSIQRSLTPHLDCCPETFYECNTKWRPIQCFVSLSDALEPNMGGFEAAKGFHREFDVWRKTRPPTTINRKMKGVGYEQISFPAPCVGEYTHIRPVEDREVMSRVQHVPVRAGSAVLWDNRLPHANSYRHNGTEARAVVYCSFLPDVAVNRVYVSEQLQKLQRGMLPTDQWRNPGQENGNDVEHRSEQCKSNAVDECLLAASPDMKKLLGIKPW
jgi:Protein of unknown function (DUF1479)